MKLSELATLLEGRLVGNGNAEITGVKGLSDAANGDVSFFADSRYKKALLTTEATALIVKEPIEDLKCSFIIVENPYYAFAKTLAIFPKKVYHPQGVSDKALIDASAQIGANAIIYPGAFISANVSIGDNSVIYPGVFIGQNTVIGRDALIYPNVVIREYIQIGNNVIIHPGAVIGADGFGYVFDKGQHNKIPQIGGVIIEDNVEIGANSTIDRATIGATLIKKGAKIDNLVQVAHNVVVGSHCVLVSQTGISGSSTLGNGVIIAGQSGIGDHVNIADGVTIGSKSGVGGDVKTRGVYTGIPAIPHKKWLRAQSIFAKLPELLSRLRLIESKLNINAEDR
jgi:UDP-3-O-[3-hydroxymyristoyl] glucosamine N-acyltransferase